MIRVQDFCKAYQEQLAVDHLTFDVQSGQVLGLIGPNGAGKTTTMRALAGLIPASDGQLLVDGFDVEDDPVEVKRRTAYVPDDPQLFNELTVAQHFAFVASAYHVEFWEQRMHQLLEMFELDSKVNNPASDLSRGMRQKLALACAWLYRPQALLLDEPMTGLDPMGIRSLKQSIRRRAAKGSAIIISSHLLAMVEDICTHVLILERGQRKFYGDIDQLRAAFSETDSDKTSLETIFSKPSGRPERLSICPTRPLLLWTQSSRNGMINLFNQHPATRALHRQQSRARIRQLWKSFRSPRRALLSTFALLLGLVWIGQAVAGLFFREAADPEKLTRWITLGLTGFALWNLIKITFRKPVIPFEWTEAEREWLGAAPLTRQQLIRYRLAGVSAARGIQGNLVCRTHGARLALLAVGICGSLPGTHADRIGADDHGGCGFQPESKTNGLDPRDRCHADFDCHGRVRLLVVRTVSIGSI